MTVYRFRIHLDENLTTLWRDIEVGADRTITEFQTVLNRSVGLNQRHLWFFGTDQDYWDSDIQYLRPAEFQGSPLRSLWGGTAHDASNTTIGEMVTELALATDDRICYLFDYGDEWRFYATLTEIDEEAPSDNPPDVVAEHGTSLTQYAPPENRR